MSMTPSLKTRLDAAIAHHRKDHVILQIRLGAAQVAEIKRARDQDAALAFVGSHDDTDDGGLYDGYPWSQVAEDGAWLLVQARGAATKLVMV